MNKKNKMKTFVIDGLNIYITNVASRDEAALIALRCRYGVSPNNLIEIERVPAGVQSYEPGRQPRYEGHPICIDPMLEFSRLRQEIY